MKHAIGTTMSFAMNMRVKKAASHSKHKTILPSIPKFSKNKSYQKVGIAVVEV